MVDNATSRPVAPVKGALAVSPAVAKEPTVQQRLETLLVSMRANYDHNAPIAPGHMKELESLVALGRGDKGTTVRHDLAKHVLVAKPDGNVTVVYTAEEALDFVRALPVEVRDRVHWIKAERLLLAAIEAGPNPDVNAATQAFADALAEDRKLAPLDRKPDELLPDGRIREDRFADRRPPAPPGSAEQPAAAS